MANSLTLLLITHSQIARVDVVRNREVTVKNVWLRSRIPNESVATQVDAAIRLGPNKTGDVWVYSSEFWTGVVHLAADLAGELDTDELHQALALEAENYSGVSAFDSRMGTKEIPTDLTGERRWWVTQIPLSDWHNIGRTLTQFGSKLAGIGHPSLPCLPSLPNAPSTGTEDETHQHANGATQTSWRLLQVLGELTVGVQGIGSEVTDVVTLGSLATQRNQDRLDDWCLETGHTPSDVTWITDGAPLGHTDTTASAILALTEEAPRLRDSGMGEHLRISHGEPAFGQWAIAMTESLGTHRRGHIPNVPVAIAEKTPMSSRQAALVAAGCGVLAVLICFGLYSATASNLLKLEEQIETLDAQKQQLANKKKVLIESEQQLTIQQKTLTDLESRSSALTSNLALATRKRQFQQTRWLELLNALAKSHDEDLWIRGITSDRDKVTVLGIAVSNQNVTDFTSKLESLAGPHGWQVHPAEMKQSELAVIEFEVDLNISDAGLANSDPAADSIALDDTGDFEVSK